MEVNLNWHFSRLNLARLYLDQFGMGISSAITLFAPRRYGKTEFLLMDLVPTAESNGYRVVYSSMWASRSNPLMSLLYAISDAARPTSLTDKIRSAFSTPIRSIEIEAEISLLGKGKMGVDFEQSTQFPANMLLEINTKLDELLSKSANGKVLLLLDEVQYLAKPQYEDFIAALRTALDTRKGKVVVVFTGSSRIQLQRMFDDIKAPLFLSSQTTNFPHLDSEFVLFMLSNYRKATGRDLDTDEALAGFDCVSKSPGLFREAIETSILSKRSDINAICQEIIARVEDGAGYGELWGSLKDIDRFVLLRVIDGQALFTGEACQSLADKMGVGKLTPQQVQVCVKRLESSQLLLPKGKGNYEIEDPRFASWVSKFATLC